MRLHIYIHLKRIIFQVPFLRGFRHTANEIAVFFSPTNRGYCTYRITETQFMSHSDKGSINFHLKANMRKDIYIEIPILQHNNL